MTELDCPFPMRWAPACAQKPLADRGRRVCRIRIHCGVRSSPTDTRSCQQESPGSAFTATAQQGLHGVLQVPPKPPRARVYLKKFLTDYLAMSGPRIFAGPCGIFCCGSQSASCGAQAPEYTGFSSCRVQMQLPLGMWDLTFPTRTEPTSPELQGRVLTTGPPGKSHS